MKTNTIEQPTDATEALKTNTQTIPDEMPNMSGEVYHALVTLAKWAEEIGHSLVLNAGSRDTRTGPTLCYSTVPLLRHYEEYCVATIKREQEEREEKAAHAEAYGPPKNVVPGSIQCDAIYQAVLYAFEDATDWFTETPGKLEAENERAYKAIEFNRVKAQDALSAVIDATIQRKIAEALNPDRRAYDSGELMI